MKILVWSAIGAAIGLAFYSLAQTGKAAEATKGVMVKDVKKLGNYYFIP